MKQLASLVVYILRRLFHEKEMKKAADDEFEHLVIPCCYLFQEAQEVLLVLC